jgi:hypothetical protein
MTSIRELEGERDRLWQALEKIVAVIRAATR